MLKALESRYDEDIGRNNNSIPWLVKHAAARIIRYAKGKDGATAYKRLNGKNYRRNVYEFGECVWYLKPKTKVKEKIRCR